MCCQSVCCCVLLCCLSLCSPASETCDPADNCEGVRLYFCFAVFYYQCFVSLISLYTRAQLFSCYFVCSFTRFLNLKFWIIDISQLTSILAGLSLSLSLSLLVWLASRCIFNIACSDVKFICSRVLESKLSQPILKRSSSEANHITQFSSNTKRMIYMISRKLFCKHSIGIRNRFGTEATDIYVILGKSYCIS